MTSLLVSVLLLILGLSFLTFLENDYRFAGRQEKNQEAYYLALGGLQLQRSRPDLFPKGATVLRPIPKGDLDHFARVTCFPDGHIESEGIVYSTNFILARRKLIVEPGKSAREYRDETL